MKYASVILLATLLTSCSDGTGMSTPGTATDICNFADVPEFTLVSPAPGATNVADSTSALTFSGTLFNQTGATESIKLVASTGATSTITTFNATNGGYSVPLPALVSATTYTVDYVITNDGVTGACASATSNEGSFTTQ
jgi:hypothetical protein